MDTTTGRSLVLWLLVSASCSYAQTSASAGQRAQAFAALPDWRGVWEPDTIDLDVSGEPPEGDIGFFKRLKSAVTPPAFTPAWLAQHPPVPLGTHKGCEFGFPGIMDNPSTQFELIMTPEQTIVLPTNLTDTRQIFTDGRSHPSRDDLWMNSIGDSIGRWEGHTLVVDTIGRKLDETSPIGSFSDQAHYVERIRVVARNRLEDQLTVEDPQALTRPWQVTYTYRKAAGVDRLIPVNCTENDRNPVVDGHFVIAPAKPPSN